MTNKMSYKLKDIYPGMAGTDSDTELTPKVDDQDALNEDTQIAEKASPIASSGKAIFGAVAIIFILAVFMGR